MSSGSNARRGRKHNLLSSFRFAWQGIFEAARSERNFKIHLAISAAVFVAGIGFSLSAVEWVSILLAIGGMLALELLNTALEKTIDLVTEDYHPLAKQAKDLAAGSVLVFAVISVIVGFIIFIPKILLLL